MKPPQPTEEQHEYNIKTRRIDAYRYPRSDAAKHLITAVITDIEDYETTAGTRKRRRKDHDRDAFVARITAVISDLIHRHLTLPGGGLSISLAHENLEQGMRRYAGCLATKTLTDILTVLEQAGWVAINLGAKDLWTGKGSLTTILPTDRLTTEIRAQNLWLEDFGRSPGEETIILKRVKDPNDHRDNGGPAPYEDTDDIHSMRAEVEVINNWLASANIKIDDTCEGTEDVDPTDRRLRRIFNNGSFEQGGRLFGGFWQPINNEVRINAIQIDNEDVVVLDFVNMTPRILYGLRGAEPPEDIYEIPGFPRDLIKKVIAASLNITRAATCQKRQRFPQGIPMELKGKLKITEVLAAIQQYHPVLAAEFFKGIGLTLMKAESDILVSVLLKLNALGITALPVHDAVIVAKSNAETVRDIMEETFKEHVGISGVVTIWPDS